MQKGRWENIWREKYEYEPNTNERCITDTTSMDISYCKHVVQLSDKF